MNSSRHLVRYCLMIVMCPLAWGQAATLEVQPNAISVSPSYSSVAARVVLKTGSGSIAQPSLSWMSNDGVLVKVEKSSSSAAAAGQAIVWNVTVSNLDHTRLPASVLFQANYVARAVAQHTFATLSLTSQADSTQKPIEASIEGNFDSVSEQRPGSAFLVVTNNLDVPVHISAGFDVPADIFQQPSAISDDAPPRSTIYKKITLKTLNRITPGTYTILTSVHAQWNWGTKTEERRIALAKPATAGVFFESDLLKVLGVPSFLLLPGCLFLFTMQLYLTLGLFNVKDDSSSHLAKLTVTSPGFWIIAGTLSAAFTWAYAIYMKNNNLLRYGLQDLRNVWIAGIGFGTLAYFLYAWLTYKKRRDHVPSANDKPIVLLRKMARNKVPIPPSKVRYKFGSAELEGYVVERTEDDTLQLWVTPQISVDWVAGAEAAKAEASFQTAINQRREWAELADMLEAALTAHHTTDVRWSTSKTGIPQPYHLKKESIVTYLEPEKIFATV